MLSILWSAQRCRQDAASDDVMEVAISAPPEIEAAFADGRRSGGWIGAYCPICDPTRRKRGQLTLRAGILRSGPRAGQPWWGCMRCHCEKDFAAARRTARLRLQFDLDKQNADDARKRAFAIEMIEAATFIRDGDPVDRYLRDTRGLTPVGGSWSTDLRVAHRRHSQHRDTRQTGPVMIAVVRGPAGYSACHRTYLHELPGGRVVQISDSAVPRRFRHHNAKLSLGAVVGHGVVMGDGPARAVGEGIESTLALAMYLNLPSVAGLSANGMRMLVLPSSVVSLYIGPDIGDKPLRKNAPNQASPGVGLMAAYELQRRALEESQRQRFVRKIEVCIPPKSCGDWGDWAKERAR